MGVLNRAMRGVVVLVCLLVVWGADGATTKPTGNGSGHENRQPILGLSHIIRVAGETLELGEIGLFGGGFAPRNWMFAEGQTLPINTNLELFSLLGTAYGGNGHTDFRLPDMRERLSVGMGTNGALGNLIRGASGGESSASLSLNEMPSHNHGLVGGRATGFTGAGQPHSIVQPYVATNYLIATQGVYPSRNLTYDDGSGDIAEFGPGLPPLIGEVQQYASILTPGLESQGWMKAEGQLLSIASNSALFSILGTMYGGDGMSTFGLPDLRGRAPIGAGHGLGLANRRLGEEFGTAEVELSVGQIGSHHHVLKPSTNVVTDNTGLNQRHTNMQPSLGLNYIVSLSGLFPSRNLTYDDGSLSELGNSEPYLGSVAMFAGNFAPRGWALAEGQILPINLNQSLFSLFGTAFGGDGRTTFGLPDLRGRAPVHFDSNVFSLGQRLGIETALLAPSNLPSHVHDVFANIPGDFNFDGTVNIADLIIWAQHFGQQGSSVDYEDGDGVQDEKINIADLIVWAQNFGQVEGGGGSISVLGGVSGAVAIPEPSGVVVIFVGLMCVVRRRKGVLNR